MPPTAAESSTATAPPREVLLMGTCLCDSFFPGAAIAAVRVLEHAGCTVRFPEDQTCCGQPAFNSGDFKTSRRVARHTAAVFAGEQPIIVPSGSCAAMHQHGNGLQFEGEDDRDELAALGRRTWELCDFLANGLGVHRWPGHVPQRIALHHSCHTRGGGTGAAMATLLGSIGGVELVEFAEPDQCCGFGGTFSVSFPHISKEMGCLKIEHVLAAEPDLLVSADLSCLMHLRGLADKAGRELPVRHAAEILADALDSIPSPIPNPTGIQHLDPPPSQPDS